VPGTAWHKRRADGAGLFPAEAPILRLIGAVLLAANDEWHLPQRRLRGEAVRELANPLPAHETPQLPSKAA